MRFDELDSTALLICDRIAQYGDKPRLGGQACRI
jgi:hypothetical protein